MPQLQLDTCKRRDTVWHFSTGSNLEHHIPESYNITYSSLCRQRYFYLLQISFQVSSRCATPSGTPERFAASELEVRQLLDAAPSTPLDVYQPQTSTIQLECASPAKDPLTRGTLGRILVRTL